MSTIKTNARAQQCVNARIAFLRKACTCPKVFHWIWIWLRTLGTREGRVRALLFVILLHPPCTSVYSYTLQCRASRTGAVVLGLPHLLAIHHVFVYFLLVSLSDDVYINLSIYLYCSSLPCIHCSPHTRYHKSWNVYIYIYMSLPFKTLMYYPGDILMQRALQPCRRALFWFGKLC